MMKSGNLLDLLSCDETCIGAAFTTYGFNPHFFENDILRTLLDLQSDPEERALDYLKEARSSLQKIPIAVLLDPGERKGGRRLIYDVYEVELQSTAFHPKSVLLLYQEHARLIIGSGNLTEAGYSSNLELFSALDIRYDSEEKSHLLKDYLQFLERLQPYVRQKAGRQLTEIKNELNRKITSTHQASEVSTVSLLDSTKLSIMEQIDTLIPKDASILSISMLAPFFESDSAKAQVGKSIFTWFPETRLASNFKMEFAFEWEYQHETPESENFEQPGLGHNRVWLREIGVGKNYHRSFLIPYSRGPKLLRYYDESGASRQVPIAELETPSGVPTVKQLKRPTVFAPEQALNRALKDYQNIDTWLYPINQPATSIISKRALHAKLILISYKIKNDVMTFVTLGSANMSRRALLFKAGHSTGNVELNLGFVLNGNFSLRDFLPELVKIPIEALNFEEREILAPDTNYRLAIQDATYDPESSSLSISWSSMSKKMKPWKLQYFNNLLVESEEPPSDSIILKPFELNSYCLELTLNVGGKDFDIPINITDVIKLPEIEGGATPGLIELLQLLGRRIGCDEIFQITRINQSLANHVGISDTHGEELFKPADVYRAWWSIAEDLIDPSLTYKAFRYLLEGPLGVQKTWETLITSIESGVVQSVEAWYYGVELLKALSEVRIPDSTDQVLKQKRLKVFTNKIISDIQDLKPVGSEYPWLDEVTGFYGEFLV